MIRLTRPYFEDAERAAVARVLDSGMLVQGAEVAAFERAVTDVLLRSPSSEGVVSLAVTNGTVALELALATTPIGARVGIGPEDEVIVPAVTWPSPGHAAILRGATPVLVDIDPSTWCIDARAVERCLTPRTRAIIAIDQFGVPADIPALRALASDVDMVEDAACSLGSSLHGIACGLLGDVATMSFHPRKVVTTGEGGMVMTRDALRADRVRALRNHGQRVPGDFVTAGPNARLSELHGALGVVQMTRLDTILSRRRAMAEEIRAAVDLNWQGAPDGAVVNHQTLGFVLPTPPNGDRRAGRDSLITALRDAGIEAGILSYALHRLPQFARYAANGARAFPVAEAVVDGGVAVPLHPLLTPSEVSAIIDGLRRHAGWALGRRESLGA